MLVAEYVNKIPTMGENSVAHIKSCELLEVLQLTNILWDNQQPSIRFKSLMKVQRLPTETINRIYVGTSAGILLE